MRSGYKSLTAARKAAVLKCLRSNPSTRSAARTVGLHHSTIQYWVDTDAAFARKVDDARLAGVGRLEGAVFSRAIDGVERCVVSQGKIVRDEDGSPLKIREYSDALAARLLQAHGGPAYRDKSSVEISGDGGAPLVQIYLPDNGRANSETAAGSAGEVPEQPS